MYKGHDGDSPAELESQFILRLPVDAARILREAIRNNSSLKDRVAIKIENDLRHGEVRVDHYLLTSKVVDIPTIVESLKTIDGKGFYKTADICQMLICKEEDDQSVEEDSPQKVKKKDPNKVEKKYLWPHGITPPAKNVRRRRFRKTLKKKYVEAPEIEKEVKRLLRIDNDAVSVKWEVINEDDDNKVNKGTVIKKKGSEGSNEVAEQEIFGSAVSDSEEEDPLNVMDLDDNSQNSAEDSHLTDSNSVLNTSTERDKIVTEFSSDMFTEVQNSPNLLQEMDYYQHNSASNSLSFPTQNLPRASIETRLEQLKIEVSILKGRRQEKEYEIENIENLALRQRFQDILDHLLQEQMEKEQEQEALQEALQDLAKMQ